MEFTGERYVPELISAKISYEHWHRYIFASRFCSQKNVLDLASGEGYGTSFLSKKATHIHGLDVSPETIHHAKSKYSGSNIDFVEAKATELPFENTSFDVVVSFETLEHLSSEDQQLFISEINRVLKDDGLLIISTPNKKVYSDDANYSNPYHLSEFYKNDFEIYLKAYFQHVSIFSQQIISGSIITMPDGNVFSIDHLHKEERGYVPGLTGDKKDMEYLIAVCSKESFPIVSGSILIDDDSGLIEEKS